MSHQPFVSYTDPNRNVRVMRCECGFTGTFVEYGAHLNEVDPLEQP